MEEKLREYRALRRRKELLEDAKNKIEKTKEKIADFLVPKFLAMKETNEDEVLLIEPPPPPRSKVNIPLIQPEEEFDEVTSETSEVESIVQENQESWSYFITKWSIYAIIWTSLFLYFISLQFGAVYFALSCLVGIYLNTRTRPKKKGEVSAYSVFNQNCQSIDGTLKAEDLQRQMLYGIGGIRPI